MKEKFREKKYADTIRISYTLENDDGTKSKEVWKANQYELIARILKIVDEYQKHKMIQTLRGYYYDLIPFIPNAMEIYKRIGSLISDLRYSGLLDWDAMEDRHRTVDLPNEFKNLKELVKVAINSFKLKRWSDQDVYIELLSEKDTMTSRLEPLAKKYHLALNINRGYGSSSVIYSLAKRIFKKIKEGKIVRLLYVGDHDPSGLDMINDIEKRVTEFIVNMKGYSYQIMSARVRENILYDLKLDFEIVHVALTKEQIIKYNLPPNPAKLSDSRSAKYIVEHGKISWELDALKPQFMIKIVEDTILEYIDIDKYKVWIKKENKEKKALEKFGKTFV